MRRSSGALIIFAIFACAASGAVFQYSAAVPTEKGESAAFLWIPPVTGFSATSALGGLLRHYYINLNLPRTAHPMTTDHCEVILLRILLYELRCLLGRTL